MGDDFIKFDVADDFLFEVPDPSLQVQIEVEYLNEGTDAFMLQYDAQTGGPYGDGTYKEDAIIQKTDSGEFKTAVFVLSDVFFGNRIGAGETSGDFRIFDMGDGAETFRRVIVRAPAAEQAFAKGDYARETGDFERAIRFYEHAMHAGFEDPAWGHRMLGELYKETGQFDGCVANMGSVLEHNPDDIDAFLWRADCFAALGDTFSAAIHYQEFLTRSEGDPRYVEQRKHAEGVLEEISNPIRIATQIGEVLFDINNQDAGLYMLTGGDKDVDIVPAGDPPEYAWRSGNGEVLAYTDNDIEDWYMMFAIDDALIYDFPEGQAVTIIVEYLDEGTDNFRIEYDAHSGGPYSDGTFKESDEVQKTNSGEYKDAVFVLTDAVFSNRLQEGDFRINDSGDGAEIIRRVIVRWATPEQDLVHAEMLRNAGDFENAIHYYTLAIDGGINGPAEYNMRGLMYWETGQWELCIADYTEFYNLEPENPFASIERGDCYAGLGNSAKARQDYERFLALTDGNPDFDGQREAVLEWLEQNP